MPTERRFRDDGTKVTRLYKPDDRDNQMNEKDEEIVHWWILTRYWRFRQPVFNNPLSVGSRTGAAAP